MAASRSGSACGPRRTASWPRSPTAVTDLPTRSSVSCPSLIALPPGWACGSPTSCAATSPSTPPTTRSPSASLWGHPSPEGADMLPTMRDRPRPARHEGLLAASVGHRRAAMSTWARSALDRNEKLLTLCAPVDMDIAGRAGSGLTALTPDDLRTTVPPPELLRRALPDGDHGLGILIWADAVITATSREAHEEIETTVTSLFRHHSVSVLCVYDRDGDRDGAGIEHLDLAVARHPDGLEEQCLA